jgi:hypothetical protein
LLCLDTSLQGRAAKDWRLMEARQRLQEVNAGVDMLLDANRRPKRGFFEKSRQQSLIRAPSAASAARRKRRALATGKQRCRHARGHVVLPWSGLCLSKHFSELAYSGRDVCQLW